MSGDHNPASTPAPGQDVQGDGRWMSLHYRFVADSKDKEPEVVFIGDSLVQLLHQCETRVLPGGGGLPEGRSRPMPVSAPAALAGTLLSSARAQLWDQWGQHSARAVAAGERGAGAHPSQDRGGLGGDQQLRAHGRAGGGWNRGHRGPGEPAAAPGKSGRAGPAAERPAPQPTEGQEPPRQRTGANRPGGPAPGSLPGRGPRLCALGRHHQPPRHV
ncbi:platelet-activating factor acetylhydrolase IB subunit gamma isoform X3 [Sarcophilus harrisii]|uniref:platelet-activating factor acetylhydrolase IB subunit gamma isoform X3 n=1 Tax=Sarcophilus harrisii TaxID=9305 RepID=UPI001301DA5B|nr:platelet-activating factor acetylhydrolase IB subunit gamma isoform X3 [Sarcophilus harrisii]